MKSVSSAYPVVEKPGPLVLRLRAAAWWRDESAEGLSWRELRVISTADEDMTVNCFLVWDEASKGSAGAELRSSLLAYRSAAVDTGTAQSSDEAPPAPSTLPTTSK